MSRRLTKEEFIQKSILKHDNKYDYSEVEYVNMKTKVVLYCENNHRFLISPDNFLRGRKCPYCSGRNDLVNSLQKFIKKSNKIHNKKYLYHKFIYIDNKTKGIIVCKKHGDFKQTSNLHLSGSGCKKCYHESLKYNLEYFIEKSNKVHNNFYNYSESIYKDYNKSLVIICPKHGKFNQKPSVHISGSGCKKCMIDRFRIDYDSFIERSNKVHNNFYTYEKKSYSDMKTKMIIYCPIHGSFNMIPDNHISKKQGCNSCSNNISISEINWLDSLNIKEEYRQFRINLNKRLFKVDGYDPKTKTVYEFYGDFWHGNLEKYNINDINPVNNKTFGELYKKTMEREEYLKSLGYKVISIWESEYKKIYKK